MAPVTLGKRTRSSREPEPTLSLDFSAKRARRTPRKIREKEHITVHDSENQENEQPESDSEEELTPKTSRSRRTSIASTVKSYNVAPVTPSTPRHYDVFARGTTTPRHRVMSVGRLSKRMTPQSPLTPSALQTVYHQARQLFSRSADPGQLIGRDEERAQLQQFLERCKTPRPSGCLYVSGPPGTGKSAMVNRITEEAVSESGSIRKAYINCMSIKSSKDLYIALLEQLAGDADMSESDIVEALQKLFLPKKTTDVFLVVLDEIDHILTMDPDSLYRVFEWALRPTSRLTLVGIANALDLTDRFLPRLKSRNLKAELLPFLPYTAPQVKRIITERLKSLAPKGAPADFIPFFHPAAIELCSRKVSSQTGDLRRAFEICRRALDLVESETRLKHENEVKEQILLMSPSRKVLGENRNLASSARSFSGTQSISTALHKSLQTLTVETAPRVTIAHLNKVTAAAFSNGATQRLKTLNLQQKAALCSLLAIEKRNRSVSQTPSSSSTPTTPSTKTRTSVSAPTVRTLYEAYCTLCTQDSLLHPLSSSEFREVVSSLETLSLITPVDGKTGSFVGIQGGTTTPTSGRGRGRKKDVFAFGGSGNAGLLGDEKRVASCVGEKEMETAVDGMGAGILRSILSGEALD